MVLRMTMPPVEEPVTAAMLRDFLRLPVDQETDLLNRLIRVAREAIEQYCNLVMLPQNWHLQLDNWPQSGRIALYKMPVIAVEKVQGFDATGNIILFNANEWRLERGPRLQRLYLCRPQHIAIARGMQVEWSAGLASTAENLPEPLRHACLMLAAHFYENRTSVESGITENNLPDMVAQLVAPWSQRGRL